MSSEHNILYVASEMDLGQVRCYARHLARSAGFSSIDQARIVVAVGELAQNMILYARAGTVKAQRAERDGRTGVEFEFSDHGPGIRQVELALRDGYSTSQRIGMGLPGAKRMMSELEIHSTVGAGTTVVCRKWRD